MTEQYRNLISELPMFEPPIEPTPVVHPKDQADTIIIPSLADLLNEDTTIYGISGATGEPRTASTFKKGLQERFGLPSVEPLDTWLLTARERYIAAKAKPEEQTGLYVKVAVHAHKIATLNNFETLKAKAEESLTRAAGAEEAAKILQDLQPKKPEIPFARHPARLRGRHRPKR